MGVNGVIELIGVMGVNGVCGVNGVLGVNGVIGVQTYIYKSGDLGVNGGNLGTNIHM